MNQNGALAAGAGKPKNIFILWESLHGLQARQNALALLVYRGQRLRVVYSVRQSKDSLKTALVRYYKRTGIILRITECYQHLVEIEFVGRSNDS